MAGWADHAPPVVATLGNPPRWGLELLALLAPAARGLLKVGILFYWSRRTHELKPDIHTTAATGRQGLADEDCHLVVQPVLVVQDLINTRLRSFLPRL